MNYLNVAKTEREFIKQAKKMADENGFKDIAEYETLKPGDKIYFINRGKSLTYFILIVAGFISAIALILPGISVSYMFLLLGIYQDTINAVQNLYIPYLIPLGFGLILGIILTTKILEYWMSHYVKSSYLIISGFVLGSIIQVFSGFPKNIIEWILCPLLFVSARE